MNTILLQIFFCLILIGQIKTQTTIGLTQHSTGSLDNGYVLFAPIGSNNTYLIDKCGKQVKTWASTYKPGQSCYILPDGTLLRTGNANNSTFTAGGKGGIIQKIDWNGNVTWTYSVSDATKCQHHDIKALPNGNVLIIAWESKTNTQAISQGRNPALVPATLWSEQILEIQPVGATAGNVVWEWHLWDHLIQDFDNTKPNYGIVNSNPQLINLNYKASTTNSDWIHLNSIDYNPSLDQILLSSHSFNEVWIIDHSTTKTEAASHSGGNSEKGGDILYRWGNPMTYNIGSTSQFFGQHNALWIESGLPNQNQILVYNNGNGRPGGNYSTIEIINPPVTGYNYTSTLPYLPASPSWIYNAANPNNLYSQNISGAQQLSNGNILFCSGPSGTFVEIDSIGNTLWKYINPVANSGILIQGVAPTQNPVFRCSFYPATFIGFAGQTLTAGNTIENINTISATCNLSTGLINNLIKDEILIYPNPANYYINIQIHERISEKLNVELFDVFGQLVQQAAINPGTSYLCLDTKTLFAGNYLIKIIGMNVLKTKHIMISK
ncbi:MAG: aryl-sulfate sulfotransferase [Saprospiraceae bacterium]|nr:aryl-sulfate sulfotransferase [Saprospiraceae bacterium]